MLGAGTAYVCSWESGRLQLGWWMFAAGTVDACSRISEYNALLAVLSCLKQRRLLLTNGLAGLALFIIKQGIKKPRKAGQK